MYNGRSFRKKERLLNKSVYSIPSFQDKCYEKQYQFHISGDPGKKKYNGPSMALPYCTWDATTVRILRVQG